MNIALTSCESETPEPLVQVPTWFPSLPVPSDNVLTTERTALGQRLFYEPLLSRDSSISCASCHVQVLAFSDGRTVGAGVEDRLGERNVPTLANVAYVSALNADGGIPDLELQAQAPIFAHAEMDFTIAEFVQRIAYDETYTVQFQLAYGRQPDAYGISRALACFQRTFISGSSRFDQFEYQGATDALSHSELRGKALFFNTATRCSECHAPPLFTTFDYANVGLYSTYVDEGRARITQLDSDNGKFRIPTLRNIALTAPYMHDGSKATLHEVVQHFNIGGMTHPNRSALVAPIGLSDQEVDDLVAFLHALTDAAFVNNANFARP